MKIWIKLYTEILDDPKLGRLTDRQFRTCFLLFALAGRHDQSGRLPPGDVADLAYRLRVDVAGLTEDLAVLQQVDIVSHDENGDWIVVHFAKRNTRAPSDENEAVLERVHRYREKQRECNETVTPLQNPVTPVTRSDKNRIDESREENKSGADAAPDGASPLQESESIGQEPEPGPEPEPAATEADSPATFDDWLHLIECPPAGSNRVAVLARGYTFLFPGKGPPDYGRIGAFAKRHGGAGRAWQLLWQAAAARPAGEPLDYAEGIAAGNGNGRKDGKSNRGNQASGHAGQSGMAVSPADPAVIERQRAALRANREKHAGP